MIHGGVVLDSLINYLDKFGPELLVIQFGFLVILSTLFMWLWFSNRRKYHNLKHAIPANVVKSYLDSIIQNSTALKSSLFRGGGLEVNGVPSVMPLQNLGGGEGLAVNGAPSTALMEELNQKKALIASLEAQLSSSQNAQREVEAKFSQAQGNLSKAEARIKELEDLIAKLKASAGDGAGAGAGDAALKSELQMITKERDEIKDRLKEFEIISDDLANLKRLQQENEQLKKSLAAQGGALPAAAAAEPAAKSSPADVSDLLEDISDGNESSSDSSDEAQVIEDFLSAAQEPEESATEEDTSEEEMMAAMNESGGESEEDKSQSERTPEDLLSEFEKMLG
jgi:chromosome segregation ATPase